MKDYKSFVNQTKYTGYFRFAEKGFAFWVFFFLLIGFILLDFKINGAVFFAFEILFFRMIFLLLILPVCIFGFFFVESRRGLDGYADTKSMKLTAILQRKLRRSVPASSLTSSESLQRITARKLNLLVLGSYVVVDESGNAVLVIRESENLELNTFFSKTEIGELAQYMARLIDNGVTDSRQISLQSHFWLWDWTVDYYVVYLPK